MRGPFFIWVDVPKMARVGAGTIICNKVGKRKTMAGQRWKSKR
jgi:hypothetical protein